MDLRRFFSSFLLFLCSSWAYSGSTGENLGLVFVHGTNDHREDADGKYWKRLFIEDLAEALPKPDNTLVIRCDFSQYMWHEDSSGCMVDQMIDFINEKHLTQLIVYTHSDGGNVMRWILSNPTFDSRFLTINKKVKEVIALAPSSGGTILADDAIDGSVFETGLGWLLGYNNDSVKQQRIGDMAIFNDELLFGSAGRIPLPRPFRAVVGTDVTSSPFSSASYCNGYILNAALKLTQNYLGDCSDGFLECNSQTTAGTTWFYDWEKTEDGTPLSHSQSRHSCFGLEQILRENLYAQGEKQ